jgi:hypothetical protein
MVGVIFITLVFVVPVVLINIGIGFVIKNIMDD